MAFENDDGGTIARDETFDLIASNKVEGTAVYNRGGEKLGSVYNFMVGKRDGQVRYAVLSFGGLFGMGERYYPLPWNVLTYSEDHGGYVVDMDKERLEGAPYYERDKEPTWDRDYDRQIGGYYGVAY
jgi:sporulation protein YlmC with PRC-barrel domain